MRGPSITDSDIEYLNAASTVKLESDDPKAKLVAKSGVGAVIVDDDKIIAKSANVLPPAVKSHNGIYGLTVQDEERYHIIEHAERAAIYSALLAGEKLDNTTMYCTRAPCSDCARAIVWVNISKVVIAEGLAAEGDWLQSQLAGQEILARAGVLVVFADDNSA